MEVQELVRKGMRMTKPRSVSIKLRPVVSDFFYDLAASASCGYNTLIVGILEDFYDQHKDEKEAP